MRLSSMGKANKSRAPRRPKKIEEKDLAAIDKAARSDIQSHPTGKAEALAEQEKEALESRDATTEKLATLLYRKEEAEITAREIGNEELRRESDRGRDLHILRKDYTRRLFGLTVIWLMSVLFFVFLTGFKGNIPFYIHDGIKFIFFPLSLNQTTECAKCWNFSFGLTEKVLIAFITSTTASVIGIFVIVAKWLFPSEKKEK